VTNPLVKRLKLKRSAYEAMLNHVKRSIPKEACAVLLGKIVEETAIVEEVEFTRNVSRSEYKFSIEPEELYGILVKGEAKGLEMVGILHSHPITSHPSSADCVYMKLNPVVWVIFAIASFEIMGVSAYQYANDSLIEVELEFQ
jgi:proteasome lid subunit RPN8/RPN11